MKTVLLACTLITSIHVHAQFQVLPDDTVSGTFPDDEYNALNIDFPTADSASVALKWTVVKNTLPAQWDRSVCDLPNCYFSSPSSATMDPYSHPQKGFLRLSFNPMSVPGDAELRIAVEDLNSGQKDTVSFLISAVGSPSGVTQAQKAEAEVVVHTDASSQVLHVVGQAGRPYHVRVLDSGGRIVTDAAVEGEGVISLHGLPRGFYVARITTETDGHATCNFLKF
jgi:hypothetical protein